MKMRSCTKCRKMFDRGMLKQLAMARLCPKCLEWYNENVHQIGGVDVYITKRKYLK